MNKTERIAKEWLLQIGIAEEDLIFQRSRSPDFIDTKEKRGYEVKRLYKKTILLWRRQYEIMKSLDFPVDILVFSTKTFPSVLKPEPYAVIPLKDIGPETTIVKGIIICWQPGPGAKTQVKITLEEEDIQAIEDISRETGQPISGLIREAVKHWLRGRGGGEED